jgi:hypothetical protein
MMSKSTFRLAAAAAVLIGAIGHLFPDSAISQEPGGDPAEQENTVPVQGIVTEIIGQRIKLQLMDGSVAWFTTTLVVTPNLVGQGISATSLPAGDTKLLTDVQFSPN